VVQEYNLFPGLGHYCYIFINHGKEEEEEEDNGGYYDVNNNEYFYFTAVGGRQS